MLRASLIAISLLAGLVAAASPSLAAPPAKQDAAPAASKPAIAADTLKVVGPTGQALTLKAADLAAMPHITVKASIHDKEYTFEDVELSSLLSRAGTPTGQALRGPAMSEIVLATAADGYRLALSLVETDPRFRANRILVADRMDGMPLNARDGPFRLVVEGDLDAGRLVRNLAMIEVRKLD
jgi:hypothetical protein